MANSKYGYVRSFEQPDGLLPNTFIVVRIDGRGFTKLTTKYEFVKPNDRRALDLMNAAAEAVMKDLPDLVLAYGQSDEFSFVFHKDSMLFERRASKLTTTVVSTFTANYVLGWAKFFPDAPLTTPLPSFDGRAVCYPSDTNLRDYLSWRQVDCHINNLYNTSFWALVQKGGMEHRAAEQELSGTVSADKNEILFSRFGINYNNEPDIFKKGSVLYRDFSPTPVQPSPAITKTRQSSTPPLSQPKPKRIARPMSQPLERSTFTDLLRDSPTNNTSSSSTPRGPTFLSTSTTPSPPPSPPSMSIPTVANPLPDSPTTFYPQTFTPVSPPAQNGNIMRQPLPQLTPLPLPPPTLKPSTRPPPSLTPPNPTTYTSPLPSPTLTRDGPGTIPERTTSTPTSKRPPRAPSHSAHASLSTPRPQTASAPTAKPSPKRSPSMSALDFGPPQIPLRISSIPADAPPRKLSLPSQKSYSMLRAEEKENTHPNATANFTNNTLPTVLGGHRKTTPPHLKTMKELPSPPPDDFATRTAVMGSEPPKWSTSPTPTRHSDIDRFIINPVVPKSPSPPIPPRNRPRGCSHSRLNSAPPTTTAFTALGSHPLRTEANTVANMYGAANGNGNKAVYDEERAKREREDRIRFAHFDWSPTIVSPSTSPTSHPPDSNPDPSPTITTPNAIPMPPPFTRSRSSPSMQPPLEPQPPPPPPKPTTITNPASHHQPRKDRHNANSKGTTNRKPQTKTNPGLDEDGSWAANTHDGRPVVKSRTQREKEKKKKVKAKIVVEHVDLIKDGFWERRPWILSGRVS